MLIRGATGVMLDHLVAEGRENCEQVCYGIEWFDQWDWRQRIWLLDQVATALLTGDEPPSAAAMLEATVDVIFCEIFELISMEIDPSFADDPPPATWRRNAIEAFRYQHGRDAEIDATETDTEEWRILVTMIANHILGLRLYRKAEAFRDAEMQLTRRFLTTRGLPDDFLEQIPPLRSVDQTQVSIDRIQSLLF